MSTLYVVKDEHTLGYMLSPVCMGVLRSNVLRGAPFALWEGPQHVQFSTLRPATVADFITYRVQTPSDFNNVF